MIKRLRKIGNSTGLIVDKPILAFLGIRAGDSVRLALVRGVLTVTPVRPSAARRP